MRNKMYTIEPGPGENVISACPILSRRWKTCTRSWSTPRRLIKFGLAFCEASGPCLVRSDGNDAELIARAEKTAYDIGAGHSFVVFMRDGYPINVLPGVESLPRSLPDFLRHRQSGRGVDRGDRTGTRDYRRGGWILTQGNRDRSRPGDPHSISADDRVQTVNPMGRPASVRSGPSRTGMTGKSRATIRRLRRKTLDGLPSSTAHAMPIAGCERRARILLPHKNIFAIMHNYMSCITGW